MDKSEYIEELSKIEGLVSICQFGSYGTEYWMEDVSDIDLVIVTAPDKNFMYTLKIEDDILELAKKFYKYDDIHLTFVLFNEFSNKYAKIAVDSDNKFIINDEKWFDFQHYVCKYARNNENLERTLKIDEQFSYFGRIIDESLFMETHQMMSKFN